MRELFIQAATELFNDPSIRSLLKGIACEAVLEAEEASKIRNAESENIDSKTACRLLSISRITLNNWCKKGTIPKFKVKGSNKTYYTLKSINDILRGANPKKGGLCHDPIPTQTQGTTLRIIPDQAVKPAVGPGTGSVHSSLT